MEGITKGIRPEEETPRGGKVKVKDAKDEKQLKYKIKTRYGNIPVFEKKEKAKCKNLKMETR